MHGGKILIGGELGYEPVLAFGIVIVAAGSQGQAFGLIACAEKVAVERSIAAIFFAGIEVQALRV